MTDSPNTPDAEQLYQQFEAELSSGGLFQHVKLLETWLCRADIQSISGHPQTTFRELLLIELHWKQERQLPVQQNDYQQRFPQQQQLIQQIFAEFERRRQEMLSSSPGNVNAVSGKKTASHPAYFAKGRYRTLRPLGQGGFGQVYECKDEELGRTVAIKVSRLNQREAAEILKREASVLAQMSCRGIPEVYEVFVEQIDVRSALCMASQFIKGRTLADVFAAEHGSTDFNRIAATIAEIADILQGIHSRGIYHWDLKPSNIMVADDGKTWLLDFGLAVLEKHRSSRLNRREGTVSYMSPEQADCKNRDGRSDIWSLGVILYELLTGRLPFEGRSSEEILRSIRSTSPTPPRLSSPGVPRYLERVTLKCLQYDPASRFNNGKALSRSLKLFRYFNLTAIRAVLMSSVLLVLIFLLSIPLGKESSWQDHQPEILQLSFCTMHGSTIKCYEIITNGTRSPALPISDLVTEDTDLWIEMELSAPGYAAVMFLDNSGELRFITRDEQKKPVKKLLPFGTTTDGLAKTKRITASSEADREVHGNYFFVITSKEAISPASYDNIIRNKYPAPPDRLPLRDLTPGVPQVSVAAIPDQINNKIRNAPLIREYIWIRNAP